MKIIADAHIPYVKEYFHDSGELILKPGRAITPLDVKEADLLLVRSVTPVNRDLLQQSRVKFVGSVTAGADHLDTAWIDEVGIAWCTASGFNALPVADYVVACVAVLQTQSLLKRSSQTAAVIGVGHVGSLVAKQLKELGFEVLLCDPLRAQTEPDFIHHPLETIADVDLLCLHVPLVPGGAYPTYHFINDAFLKKQKPGCVLLNAARGAVVDSDALMRVGTHLTWCFDVWENEPQIDPSILAKTTIATPHIAGYSVQSKMRGIAMIYQTACEKKIIPLKAQKTFSLPQHTLVAHSKSTWQDIVLNLFNPLTMTKTMQTTLSASSCPSDDFDKTRRDFNDRHEFGYTRVVCDALVDEDRAQLARLGFLF